MCKNGNKIKNKLKTNKNKALKGSTRKYMV